jgi:hypothetical protein
LRLVLLSKTECRPSETGGIRRESAERFPIRSFPISSAGVVRRVEDNFTCSGLFVLVPH